MSPATSLPRRISCGLVGYLVDTLGLDVNALGCEDQLLNQWGPRSATQPITSKGEEAVRFLLADGDVSFIFRFEAYNIHFGVYHARQGHVTLRLETIPISLRRAHKNNHCHSAPGHARRAIWLPQKAATET